MMKCPVDGVELMMTARSGVEIDYCPQCRGIWLDRGELDKLIERAEAAVDDRRPAAAAPPPPRYPDRAQEPPPRYAERPQDPAYRYHDDDDDDRRYGYEKPKKKRSMLGEMFDIFD